MQEDRITETTTENKEKKKSVFGKYKSIAVTVFLVAVGIIAVFFFFYNFNWIMFYLRQLLSKLEPIIIGLFLAYLINPLMTAIENVTKKRIAKIAKKERTINGASRGIAITVSMLAVIGVIIVVFYLMGPQLVESVTKLVNIAPNKIEQLMNFYESSVKTDGAFGTILKTALTNIKETIANIDVAMIVTKVTTFLFQTVSTFVNFFIGLIVSIYVLASKEVFAAQIKKLMYAVFKKKVTVNSIIDDARTCNKIFGGFLVGKIIDSLIIGVLCFVLMLILGLPYAALISVIIAITNIIPVFGPFIGAIPSAFIIFLDDWVKGLIFVGMIIVLQQVDGNIIGPKVLGNSTGLSAFWVMFAILLFGGLFGFVGMLLGVPTLGVIFYLVKKYYNERLIKKGLPVEAYQYQDGAIFTDEGRVLPTPEEKKKSMFFKRKDKKNK